MVRLIARVYVRTRAVLLQTGTPHPPHCCLSTAATGTQLESERAKAQSHEATAEELKQRIATLQELKLKEQLEHSEAIDRMISQLKDAQAKVAEASEVRKKAEVKYITAREFFSSMGQAVSSI